MTETATWQRFSTAIIVAMALSLAGCANSNSNDTTTTNQLLAITNQPMSQTVPIGSAATFTVAATGKAPLSYQWSENGAEISGATSDSYTTPSIALGPNGSTSIGSFQVTVSDASGSVISNSATLTAGPRSPKPGDLRYLLYQQVDVPGFFKLEGSGHVDFEVHGNILEGSASNALGSPLGLGSSYACQIGYSCIWPYDVFFLPSPSGFQMFYEGGEYSNYASDLQSYAAPNVVFTSLDLEPAENAYAVSWVQTTQTSRFDYRMDPLVPAGPDQSAQIQAQATLDGSESRVITAVSFDASGNALLISYSWTGDTTTVYETKTTLVPAGSQAVANVMSAATALANEGYIISAFGGNDTNGYILIGMRVQGDSLPRPINVSNTANKPPYATTVVYLLESGNNNAIVNEQ